MQTKLLINGKLVAGEGKAGLISAAGLESAEGRNRGTHHDAVDERDHGDRRTACFGVGERIHACLGEARVPHE